MPFLLSLSVCSFFGVVFVALSSLLLGVSSSFGVMLRSPSSPLCVGAAYFPPVVRCCLPPLPWSGAVVKLH